MINSDYLIIFYFFAAILAFVGAVLANVAGTKEVKRRKR